VPAAEEGDRVMDEQVDTEYRFDMDPTHGAVALSPPVGPSSDRAKLAVASAAVSIIGLLALVRVVRRARRSRPAA
jgi:hypothetical protein